MRQSERKKIKHESIFRKSKINICARCSKSIGVGNSKCSKFLIPYKNVCKNSKCTIHRGGLQPKINKLTLKRKYEVIKNELIRKKSLKVKVINPPCTVDEFEDVENTVEDIDNEMFARIEAAVEDSNVDDKMREDEAVGFGMIKEIISRTIIWPLKKPEIFKGLRSAPKGILFFGPPGTGKTYLGKYIAAKTNSTFLNVSPSTLTSKWLGESEKLVRTTFLVAKARQPSVIFIDEVDSILSQRVENENGSVRRMKNEFLICMDGGDIVTPDDRILVIGATNRPQELDEAARRRFYKRFYISLPDKQARKEILLKLLQSECHSLEDIDIIEIVKKTEGYSLADLRNLSQEAAMGPTKMLSGSELVRLKSHEIRPISMGDFMCALHLIKPTVSREQVMIYEAWDSMYGFVATSRDQPKRYSQGDPYIL